MSVHEVVLASCPPGELPSPKAALESADAVFLGEVEKFEVEKQSGEVPLKIATFRVKTTWKGVKQPLVKVATRQPEGYDFIVGQEYLVYAYRPPRRDARN